MAEPVDDFDERLNDVGKSRQRYPEEDHAENLHDRLNQEVASRLDGTTVSLTLMGVNSYCQAKRGQRACTIFCFDTRGPQFLARFEEKPTTRHLGRTFTQTDVMGAVGAWLEGASPQELFLRFPFVERRRRVLDQIEEKLLAAEPALAGLTHELISSEGSESCSLWFRTNDRSCEVDYYAHNGVPDAQFYWDKCFQFGAQLTEVPTSHVQTEEDFLKEMSQDIDAGKTVLLARMIKRWLCEQAMPSAIQREYPWIVLSDTASWYEQGRGVEGEFLASWRHVQEFYQSVSAGQPFTLQVLDFISQLREGGYERTLRAGTSLFSLLVSRSRRHGLRHTMQGERFDPGKHDPYIAFRFGGLRFNPEVAKGQMEVTAYLDNGKQTMTYPSIELTPDLDALLKRLEATAIC